MVVGASLAGVHAAAGLRRMGFDGDLLIVDTQTRQPYDRPPLSKELLSGRFDVPQLGLRAADNLDATWRLGATATGVELHRGGGGTLHCGDTPLRFDGLVVASGATARTLPGTESIDGVQTLRDLTEALALRDALDGGLESLVVVGAGFIGLEVAATCRQRGVDVTVVEVGAQPLSRVLGDEVGAAVTRLHRSHGVDMRLGVGVDGIGGTAGNLTVALDDGSVLSTQRVVVGIGVTPSVGWLDSSGVILDDGIICDETLLAAPGVVAAGDVARWPSQRYGARLRIEHWDHAIASGEAAARRLLEGPGVGAFDPTPWFWSDQYDTKLQLVGLPGPDVHVVAGTLHDDRFAVVFGRDGIVSGVLGFNRPRHVAMMRTRVADAASTDEVVAAVEAL